MPVSSLPWQVSGIFWQTTQPISAASLPLPTGAATSAKQDEVAANIALLKDYFDPATPTTAEVTLVDQTGVALDTSSPVPVTSVDFGTTSSSAVTNPATNAALISYVRGWLTGLGQVADAAWTSGSGSLIALLKAIATTFLPVSTASLGSLASSASNAQLLASTPGRRGLILYNTDANAVLIKYGTTASATSFTARLVANGYWEMPQPIYTGRIDAIWEADGSGSLYSTELS